MASQQWDLYKSEIERLYIHENKKLEEVMSSMENQYSWKKSEASYTRQLKKWGLTKNSQGVDHQWISRQGAKRKRGGKESEFFIGGVQLHPKKITKAKYGKGYVPTISQYAPSPKTPEGYLVATPQTPGMCVSWNSSLPWLRFMSLLEPPTDQEAPLPSSSLFVDSSRHSNAMIKGANFELMQRLSSVVPWTKLQHPPNMYSGSRTSAALTILMPEIEQGQHDILSTNLSTLNSGLRDYLSVALYLISNNLTPRDPNKRLEAQQERDDKLVLRVLKDTGWDYSEHLRILLSTREPTAESITEKVFASALRSKNFEILENMLRSGMSPNGLVESVTRRGFPCLLTPLQFAARQGDPHLIDLLINYGADVEVGTERRHGKTALYFAIKRANEPAIRALCLRGAKVTWHCAREAAAVKPGKMQDFSLIEDMINIYLDKHLGSKQDNLDLLFEVVTIGNVPIIELFLARGANLNGIVHGYHRQTTLLGWAVETRNIDTVQLLTHVSIGTDPLPSQSRYSSPLGIAVEKGLTDITEALLTSGADVRAADEEATTLLERAAQNNDPALCQILIKHGAKIDREPCDIHESPSALMIAVRKSHVDTIDLLINSNARTDDRFKEAPCTVLAAALEVGHEAVINKLMNAGARCVGYSMDKIGDLQTAIFMQGRGVLANVLYSSGPKILAAAISNGHEDLAHFLLQNNADEEYEPGHVIITPLRAATRSNNMGFIQALLERGAKVTDDVLTDAIQVDIGLLPVLLKNFSEKAPTAVAAALMEPSMVALELLREANVDLTGAPRLSALDLDELTANDFHVESILEIAAWGAAESTHFKYLLKSASAAEITWPPKAVAHALTRVLLSGNHDNLVELMHLDSDLSHDTPCEQDECYTPLQAAVKAQLVWVVRDLLLKRADVNYCGDDFGARTPLQAAVEHGNMEIFNILLDHGADINAPAAEWAGATALQIAAMHGYIGIAQRLLDLGADVNQEPGLFEGRTALMGAAEHGRIDMLHMLLDRGALVVDEHEEYYHKAVELARDNGQYAAANLLETFKVSVEASVLVFE